MEFQIAVLVYKALNDLAPRYLSDYYCQLVIATSHRQLQGRLSLSTGGASAPWPFRGKNIFQQKFGIKPSYFSIILQTNKTISAATDTARQWSGVAVTVVDLTKVKHVYSDDDDNNIAVTDVIIIIACFAF